MNRFLLTLFSFFIVFVASAQVIPDQTNVQLATQYYNNREFEKAAPLLKEVYETSKNRYYYRLFLLSLAELQRYDEAIDDLKREIRKSRDPQADLLVHWGAVLKLQKNDSEATERYQEALKATPSDRASYINTANMFLQWREYEWAEKLYMQGRKLISGEKFHSELASVYLYLRNYSQMLDELLELVKIDEKQLTRVQSSLSSAMYLDIENNLRDEFRTILLKRIQSEPDVIAYNRLLIWFFIQERQFAAALRQYIALDRRTGAEEPHILALAHMAINSQNFEQASSAYDYILLKGTENPSWTQAFIYKLHSDYQFYTTTRPDDKEYGALLAGRFEEGLKTLGMTPGSVFLIREYAHLLAFFLERPEEATTLLQSALEIKGLRLQEMSEIKTELADVFIYAGDPYEAILLYSQVIDLNRNNTLGDEVKLKKAKLGYYMGNFSWAAAQLDVLKASTSKLTANDAMELSIFLHNNVSEDSINKALQFFANADLLFFRNKNEEAMAALDSIDEHFPYHSLIDDVLFRKSKIHLKMNKPEFAVEMLERIVKDFGYDLLADDALYLLAETYNFRLNNKDQAMDAYRKIMFDHPGSIYVPDARDKFRALQGENPDAGIPAPGEAKEDLF
jgi:predicted Zn-dependent protease